LRFLPLNGCIDRAHSSSAGHLTELVSSIGLSSSVTHLRRNGCEILSL
jgi:hypothetical protein